MHLHHHRLHKLPENTEGGGGGGVWLQPTRKEEEQALVLRGRGIGRDGGIGGG